MVLFAEPERENRQVFYDPSLEGRDTCETIRVLYTEYPGKSIRGLFDYFVIAKTAPTQSPWGLYRPMLREARDLARNGRFDAIWVTSPFIMVLKIAGVIAREFEIPWVADLRDLMNEIVLRPGALARWRIRLETNICRSADALITVTQPLADTLASRHTAPVYVVPNGFDPDDFPPPEESRSEYFDVVYAGSVYGKRDPTPLFDALDRIRRDGDELDRLRVRFYGVEETQLAPYLRGRPCADAVRAMGRVPFREMTRIQQRASLLLFLTHADVRGIMTAKMFDYLAARRTILSVSGDNDVTDAFLRDTRAGVVGRTPEEIAKLIREYYAEWKNTGSVQYHGLPDKIAGYTREKQAEQTAEVLNSICKR